MCGIFGMVNGHPVANDLVKALELLEYRGYDSAGVATVTGNGIERRRTEGRVRALSAELAQNPLDGHVGIAHTRWATHGAPVERNAHPHRAGAVAVVHNGIIENHRELRHALEARGRVFTSDTDTEVIAHLVDEAYAATRSPADAIRAALAELRGSFAIGVIFEDVGDHLYGARRGSPLAVGATPGLACLASDALALAPHVLEVRYLEDGDVVVLGHEGAVVFDREGAPVERAAHPAPREVAASEMGPYAHYMEKEIFEQPEVVRRILRAYTDEFGGLALPALPVSFADVDRLLVVACGSSRYAAEVMRPAFERLAGLPVDVEIASELRYRDPPLSPRTAVIFVSQSGETADTVAAERLLRARGLATIALVNVVESTLGKEAIGVVPLLAGPEIGVASTKAFVAQMLVFLLIALQAAEERGRIGRSQRADLVRDVATLPFVLETTLVESGALERAARALAKHDRALFVGRGPSFGLALEGALKLKEISYLFAEAHAAGELKHGPIALVDAQTPVVAVAPSDVYFEKTSSNLEEIAARGGPLFVLTDDPGAGALGDRPHVVHRVPTHAPLLAPFVYVIPLQVLAYRVAVALGRDVDRPRNLAKSVTVE